MPNDQTPAGIANEVVKGLEELGYRQALLAGGYVFPDWFDGQKPRTCVAAAFGETPVSYESACIGVARANGLRGEKLVDAYRALGAPVLLEIDGSEIREWAVSRNEGAHKVLESYPASQIRSALTARREDWTPVAMLRAKNLGTFRWTPQLSLFSGLIPELEIEIQRALKPILEDALSITASVYRASTGQKASPPQLFKLVFWLLTAKVFHDRRHSGFVSLPAESESIFAAIAKQYPGAPTKILNREARIAATSRMWTSIDFRNLSVEILSQMWATTLVDPEAKATLSLHRTPRHIVRYIVERVPFLHSGDDSRIVFEPCCGSASFLVGAMNALRPTLYGLSSKERHDYFVRHLEGMEIDAFGQEVSKLALTLADYPNPDGWRIKAQDVFRPGAMKDALRRAGVVLCNPPFAKFKAKEKADYAATFHRKPAEILGRVLDDLHPDGVLGFVLPSIAITGREFAKIRQRLARRFASIEITELPDRAFDADVESALVIAKDPILHDVTRVNYRRVHDTPIAWDRFLHEHEVSTDYSENFGLDAATAGFQLPELPEVWSFLSDFPVLQSVAEIHRGLQWRDKIAGKKNTHLVRASDAPSEGYVLGVPPRTKFGTFERPPLKNLSVRPADQIRNSYKLDWSKRKVILNKSTRSRRGWRIAAFADRQGISCYQTFIAVWPTREQYDESILAAILNGPVANAFVATREGKIDITIETLRLIPIPVLSKDQQVRIASLVDQYEHAIGEFSLGDSDLPEQLLKEIDAAVLDGYHLPAKLERAVLDFFNGDTRQTSHRFSDYFPSELESYFSLSEYLKPGFAKATFGEFMNRIDGR